MSKLSKVFITFFALLLMFGSSFAQNAQQKYPDAKKALQKTEKPHTLKPTATKDNLLFVDFEDGNVPPTGWELTSTNASYTWKITDQLVYEGVYSMDAEYDPDLNAQDEFLHSPTVDLSGLTTATLEFAWAASYYWAVDPNNNYDISVEISTDEGTTWEVLWTEEDEPVFENFVWYETQIDLSPYTGQMVQIGFRYAGTDGAQGGFDNIAITDGEACVIGNATNAYPENGASGVAVSGTVATWDNDEFAVYNEVYFGTDPANLSMVLGDGSTLYTSADLPVLAYNTTYYWGVVSYVDENCFSAGPLWSFSTEFDPSINIIQFDNYDDGLLPDNYTIVNANGDDVEWVVYNTTSAYSGDYAMRISYNSSLAMDDWFFVGPFSFESGEEYGVNFWYRNSGTSFPENLKGVVATANDGTGIVEELFDYPGIATSEYQNSNSTFTAASSGEYYIGFHGYSDADMYYMLIDDLMITGNPGGSTGDGSFMTEITVMDNAVEGSQILAFGKDEAGTDGIDASLGELELPPVPPAGVFDARMILPGGTVASLKDIRGLDMEEGTWKLSFQPGDGGYPFTFTWDPASLPDGSFKLTDAVTGTIVNVDMKSTDMYELTNTAITALEVHYSMQIESNFEVAAGWNIVSVPVMTDDMSVSAIFPEATSDAFAFDNGYSSVTDLENGAGYWLKFANAGNVMVAGDKVESNVAVMAGWNIVGPYDMPVMVDDITSDPAGIVTSDFFGFDGGYASANELMPGKGYWVKSSAAGELMVNMMPKRGDDVESVNEAPMYTIDIATNDGASGSYALALGIDPMATDGIDSDLGETELPPLPPAGVYDARFILGDNTTGTPKDYRAGDNNYTGQVTYKMNVQYGDGATALTLDVNVPQVPGTVTVTVKDVVLNGGIVNEVLNEGVGQVVVTNMNVNSLYVIVDYNAPIPVELTSFAANVVGETIQLAWETATETNNKGFEVERSSDNETFTQIGKIDGHGTTAEKQSYNFTDHNATSGTYFYRLRQVDFDGTSTYSDVVEVEFIPTEYSLGQNYPNPFNPSTKVKFAVPVESKVTVTLYNMLGQKVKELVAAQYNVGLHEVELNASDLASGMYIYSITAQGVDGSNFVDTKKMMLMK